MRSSQKTALAVSVVLAAIAGNSLAVSTWSGGNAFGPDSMSNSFNWSGGAPVSAAANLSLVFPAGASSFVPNQNIASPLALQSLQVTGGSYQFSGNGFSFQNLGAAPSITTPTAFTLFNTPMSFLATTTWTLNGTTNLNNLVSGAANLNVTGTGSSNLVIGGGGSNIYSGTLSLNNGSLTLNKLGGVALNGAIDLDGVTANALAPNQLGTNSDVILNNSILSFSNAQQMGDLRLDNGSMLNMGASATATINGNITSTAGFNQIGNTDAQTLNLGGALRVINVTSGPGDQLVIPSTFTNGRFVKTGSGVVQVTSGSNSFNGQNIVTGGTLLGFTHSIGSVSNSATVAIYGGDFNADIISGAGTVQIGSFVTYNVAQSMTGVTEVLNSSGVLGTSSTLPLNITSSATGANVFFIQTGNGTYSGSLGGSLVVAKSGNGTLSIGGANTFTGGTSLQQGTLRLLSDGALGAGTVSLGGNSVVSRIEAVGTRVIANPVDSFIGILDVAGSGNIHFTDAGVKNESYSLTHNSTGTTIFDGKFNLGGGATLTVNSGNLVLGNPAIVSGFSSNGQIQINGGTLTVRSFNFTTLSDVTLAGGVLNAPNGYAIPLGAALQGSGGVTGRVASANGSSIIASGNMIIGDAAHVAGVNLDGELYTNQYAVNLLDANQSVLGSLTQLGTSTNVGTLSATNGLVLNFGRNITGRGTISTTNLLSKASIINGDVLGDSFADYLEFTGYVKGVGNFNNVAFSGTFAPGLSPALLNIGNTILTPSNILDMELGGLLRGGQYDAFDITGTMKLNGELKLSLINSFNPSLGNQFDLFNGTTTGTFASYNFPPLAPGLQWDTSLLYSQGIVQVVVPEPATLSLLPMLLLCGRRKRR